MYTDILETLDHIHDLVEERKEQLEVAYVAYGEDKLLPEYPSVVISPGDVNREIHTTHLFLEDHVIDVWVYHARMDQDHKTRMRSDLMLVGKVRDVLHEDYTLGGNIIFGYVIGETPGIIARGRNEFVVATRLTWSGNMRTLFQGV